MCNKNKLIKRKALVSEHGKMTGARGRRGGAGARETLCLQRRGKNRISQQKVRPSVLGSIQRIHSEMAHAAGSQQAPTQCSGQHEGLV